MVVLNHLHRWPHQVRGVAATLDAIARGVRRVLLSSPTGGGKSLMICDIITAMVAQGWYVVVYTNRRPLIAQLDVVLTAAGIRHGIRAAGYEPDPHAVVQISSVQSEQSRTLNRGRWRPHGEDQRVLAIVDEAHVNATPTVKELADYHVCHGGALVGVTATPIGLGGFYDELIVAGTTSELRKCGALVEAWTYAPSEPDWAAFRKLKKMKSYQEGQDLTGPQARSVVMTPGIFGRIWANFEKYNPAHQPTICFGTDVQGSHWIAEQFWNKGLPWAHIGDGVIWMNGRTYPADDQARADMLAASKAGDIVGISNRFMLREGVDAPWLRHCILATVFGALQSYLQTIGRVLRADNDPETVARFGSKDRANLQDHGGNYWRHGPPNADREWRLGDTAESVFNLRADRIRSKRCRRCQTDLRPRDPWCPACHFFNEIEPIVCPECSLVLIAGKCRSCGWVPTRQRPPRAVVGTDGEMRLATGDIFREHRVCAQPNGPALWERMYFRAHSVKWDATFRQAAAMFCRENRGA